MSRFRRTSLGRGGCLTLYDRKDDYAFFLKPVDVANVPGYADVIKHPMDLGTMTTKVEKGRYRSLEEFAVRLSSLNFDRHVLSHARRTTCGS